MLCRPCLFMNDLHMTERLKKYFPFVTGLAGRSKNKAKVTVQAWWSLY